MRRTREDAGAHVGRGMIVRERIEEAVCARMARQDQALHHRRRAATGDCTGLFEGLRDHLVEERRLRDAMPLAPERHAVGDDALPIEERNDQHDRPAAGLGQRSEIEWAPGDEGRRAGS